MSVRREPWGSTRDGEPVELFTFENDALRACFANFGATLVSLEIPDCNGARADVVLGFDALAEYESEKNPYFGGIVGRCANRIAGARFELEGRERLLIANEGRNHLHGGARGFDRKVWAPTLVQGGGVRFSRQSPDGEEGYPGRLDVSAYFGLRPSPSAGVQSVGVQLLARADASTPCNLTQHGYFNLAGSGTILDHELEVFASRYVVVDDELIPTGELASVEGTPFDFRTPRRIGERIGELTGTPARGYDLCYALDGERFHAPAARLRDPRSGRTLEIHTDQPGLQLYTGNHLDGLAGKNGVAYPRFGGVCLETQGFPDAVHHAHFPSILLHPGEPYLSTTVWMFAAETPQAR